MANMIEANEFVGLDSILGELSKKNYIFLIVAKDTKHDVAKRVMLGKVRKPKRMTLAMLSQDLGFSKSYLSSIRQGKFPITDTVRNALHSNGYEEDTLFNGFKRKPIHKVSSIVTTPLCHIARDIGVHPQTIYDVRSGKINASRRLITLLRNKGYDTNILTRD